MPASDPDRSTDSGDAADHGVAGSTELTSAAPVQTPSVDLGLQFNQFNVQQIPRTVLDKLHPDQLAQLMDTALKYADRADDRRFRYASERAKRRDRQRTLGAVVGGIVSVFGFSAVWMLAQNGNDVTAGILATFLVTIISVVVGSRSRN